MRFRLRAMGDASWERKKRRGSSGSAMDIVSGRYGRVRQDADRAVPRARLTGADGQTSEWKSASFRAYQRRTNIRPPTR